MGNRKTRFLFFRFGQISTSENRNAMRGIGKSGGRPRDSGIQSRTSRIQIFCFSVSAMRRIGKSRIQLGKSEDKISCFSVSAGSERGKTEAREWGRGDWGREEWDKNARKEKRYAANRGFNPGNRQSQFPGFSVSATRRIGKSGIQPRKSANQISCFSVRSAFEKTETQLGDAANREIGDSTQ